MRKTWLTRPSAAASGAAWILGIVVCGAIAPACTEEFDTTRVSVKLGTVGEEVFGAFCDRMAADALREDLTGASFRNVCHRSGDGTFADRVDHTKLPALREDAKNIDGEAVSAEAQTLNRDKALARVEVMVKHRDRLITALDALLVDRNIPVVDRTNPDPAATCSAPATSGERGFQSELADLLARVGPLYHDGTLPGTTQSLVPALETLASDTNAQAALRRMNPRVGYRPAQNAVGVGRAVAAYSGLRSFATSTIKLISVDADPYAERPPRDATGKRIAVAGPYYGQLSKFLEATEAELANAKSDTLALLGTPKVDAVGRSILTRPREFSEGARELMLGTADGLGGGTAFHLVKRDSRGYAAPALDGSALIAPFVDKDKDGLADLDASGAYITSDGSTPPAPFAVPGENASRDKDGFAVDKSGKPLYQYLDLDRTFATRTVTDLAPLVGPNNEALIKALAGAYVLLGKSGSANVKNYADGKGIAYSSFDSATSPLVDFLYASGQILGDRTSDNTLQLTNKLLTTQRDQFARVIGAALWGKERADTYTTIKLKSDSTLWDEIIDVLIKVVKVPGLLEEILPAMAHPDSEAFGQIFGNFLKFKDRLSYDPNNINGPPKNLTTGVSGGEMVTTVDRNAKLTGTNRSALMRFAGMIHDTRGVTSCNKPGAVVHAKLGSISLNVPSLITHPAKCLGGSCSFGECEVFKIDDMSVFYLDSVIGNPAIPHKKNPAVNKGTFFIRDPILTSGVAGIGASTVQLIEDSSGLTGFWTTANSRDLRGKPEWLNRLVFFDTFNPGSHTRTGDFIRDLQGPYIGSSVCPTRSIPDPVNDWETASDKKVQIRDCADGDWLQQRNPDTIFVWEKLGFYNTIRPMVRVLAKYDQEDLFLELLEILYKHLPNTDVTAAECKMSGGRTCTKEGLVAYEPLLAEVFLSDLFPAISKLNASLATVTINQCTKVDSTTGACTATTKLSAYDALAQAVRAMVNPDYAKATGLKDRFGRTGTKRNDGSAVPQTTPLYLAIDALNGMDKAFEDFAKAHPEDAGRQADWKSARSLLVDQFVDITDKNSSKAKFKNDTLPLIAPKLIELLRSQLAAQCPTSFTSPYPACKWANTDMAKKLDDSIKGPMMSTGVELVDSLRREESSRKELGRLLSYLLDPASPNEARTNVITALADSLQLVADSKNLDPFLKVMAAALKPSAYDAAGKPTTRGAVDAQLALLSRFAGNAVDSNGTRNCGKELDPNNVLLELMKNAVTPLKGSSETPIEVLLDVIADINRVTPSSTATPRLDEPDYAFIAKEVNTFLSNKERGLEQFYEIVRKGTTAQ